MRFASRSLCTRTAIHGGPSPSSSVEVPLVVVGHRPRRGHDRRDPGAEPGEHEHDGEEDGQVAADVAGGGEQTATGTDHRADERAEQRAGFRLAAGLADGDAVHLRRAR